MQAKFKGQGQMGKITIFQTVYRQISYIFSIYWPIGPKLHQNVCIDTSLAQHKENSRSRSRVKSNWLKTHFLDGVRHNFFIYRLIAPKLHEKVCIDTSFAQDKGNSRLRSKVKAKVKWSKKKKIEGAYRKLFHLPAERAQIVP